jgi:hypothetical protein
MTKIFYDHLVNIEEVTSQFKHLTVVEKEELIEIVDENIHHGILDVILKNLSQEKHEEFLIKFHHGPHDPDLLEYLRKDVEDIEKIISDEAVKIKKELLKEIKNAQRN